MEGSLAGGHVAVVLHLAGDHGTMGFALPHAGDHLTAAVEPYSLEYDGRL
jgi:hypothetical protein